MCDEVNIKNDCIYNKETKQSKNKNNSYLTQNDLTLIRLGMRTLKNIEHEKPLFHRSCIEKMV